MKAIVFVAVLVVLFLMTFQRFSEYNRYVVEGGMKGRLSEMRQRVSQKKSLDGAPSLWDGAWFWTTHGETSAVVETALADRKDSGAWGWDAKAGHVFIDCTHTDSKLSVWTAY